MTRGCKSRVVRIEFMTPADYYPPVSYPATYPTTYNPANGTFTITNVEL